jgi:hypothetical protein
MQPTRNGGPRSDSGAAAHPPAKARLTPILPRSGFVQRRVGRPPRPIPVDIPAQEDSSGGRRGARGHLGFPGAIPKFRKGLQ